MIEIKLEVSKDTPLAIADALIEREVDKAIGEIGFKMAQENIWQIAQALDNYIESQERIDIFSRSKQLKNEPQTDCAWKGGE